MTRKPLALALLLTLGGGGAALLTGAPAAVERAMFGNSFSRNMVSDEKGLPADWDVKTGRNVKWWADVGSQAYAGPSIAGGKVFVGTNNDGLRNPALPNDRGVVMAFAEATGDFLWQMTHEKLTSGRVNDWPQQGVCSTPFVEGNRLYYTSNRATLVSLDTEGLKDGNAGPVADEKAKGPTDGDVVWEYDMMAELDVFPHNLAVSSPLVVDGILYATTGNGVDEGHVNIPVPTAPSFVAVEAATGKLVWESNLPGDKILHGTWSNPAYGVIKGRPQVIFPGGDGWVYSFEPKTGKLLWKFDANPKDSVWVLGGRGTRNNIIATPVIWEDKVYIGVGQDPEHGEGVGNFWAIDASLDGDVTEKGKVWHRGRQRLPPDHLDGGDPRRDRLRGRSFRLPLRHGRPHGCAPLEARPAGRGVGLALRGRRPRLHRRRGRRHRDPESGQDQGGHRRAERGRLRVHDARGEERSPLRARPQPPLRSPGGSPGQARRPAPRRRVDGCIGVRS